MNNSIYVGLLALLVGVLVGFTTGYGFGYSQSKHTNTLQIGPDFRIQWTDK